MRIVNNVRPLRPVVGFSRLGLYYGLCVDALYNDAWWEGVVFDHADGSDERSVFFPDLCDEMKFEIRMLRQAWDWDVYNEEWSLRGDWVFLKCVEELGKEYPLTVSIKQLWYDMQEMDFFNKTGMWKCRDEALWKEKMLKVFDRYFMMTVNYLSDSLGCLTDLDSEHGVSVSTVEKENMDFAGAIVATKCASDNGYTDTRSHLGDGMSTVTSHAMSKRENGFDFGEGKSKHDSFKGSDSRAWLPAENVIVSHPEFTPDVISEYLHTSENLRKKLTQKLRKHLLYVGWKIEYKKETYMTRMRYTSPVGKVYMSLVKICEAMIKDSRAICVSYDDKGSQTSTKRQSRKMLLDQSDECFKPKVTSSTSTSNVVFEPEFCPEAVENWCKYINSNNGSLQNQCRETDSSKAKKHLSAMGWTFSYYYRGTKRELRYMSPIGKIFYSLRTACEYCIKETEKAKFETSGKCKPTKNLAIILSDGDHLSGPILSSAITTSKGKCSLMCETTPNHLNVRMQHQPLVLVGTNQSVVVKSKVPRQNKKLDVVPKQLEGEKNLSKASVRHRSKSVIRRSKIIREAAIHTTHNNPRTVLSWLIDRNIVLPRAQVQYISRKNGQALKSGQVSREGIWCDCCDKIYSLSAFESHAGSSIRRPSANIFLEDGRSLMECQQEILNQATELGTKKKCDEKNKRAYPENDVLCCICHYAGELMLCDRCPASFHMICLGLKEIPDGDWFCPSCRCALCGLGEFTDISCEGEVLRCYQCEHQYHLSCLRKRGGAKIDIDAKGNRFCSAKCKKICSGLNNLLGKPFELGSNNLTWTLVATNNCSSSRLNLADMDTLTENHSKLNVALSIMHECFEPLKDPRTKRDIVEDVIFSRSSEYSRLDCRGFYTVVLEQNEELISAATVRIFGDKVAEVPLVGTRFQYRRLGMCRFLMNELEKKLTGLGIERLVLPAVPGVLETWTNSFGFSKMTESERLQFLSYTFLDFQGTTTCQKFLQEKLPGNSSPSQNYSGPESLHGTKSNKLFDHAKPDELRTCDDSAVLGGKIGTYGPCTREVTMQTSELPQVRNERSILREKLPSEQEHVILNNDHQATNTLEECFPAQYSCTHPPSQQTSVICLMNREEENVPQMVKVGERWKEPKSISEMHPSEHEEHRLSIDQQITIYQPDDISSQDTAGLAYLTLPASPSTTGQMSYEEQHDSELGHGSHEELKDSADQHSMVKVNEECDQDQFSHIAPQVSNLLESNTGPSITSLKRKKGCLDLSDLKMYKRRARSPS